MKNFILALALAVLSTGAFAASAANTYLCHGDEGTLVSFATTSRSGQPTFSVKDAGNPTVLGEPTVTDTVLGYQVSAYRDGPSDVTRSYTLIVPFVSIGDRDPTLDVDAQLVSTFAGGLVPPFVTYAHQNNRYRTVKCTASYANY